MKGRWEWKTAHFRAEALPTLHKIIVRTNSETSDSTMSDLPHPPGADQLSPRLPPALRLSYRPAGKFAAPLQKANKCRRLCYWAIAAETPAWRTAASC